MRILLDGCIWWKVPEDLRQAGHDVEWVGDWPSDPGDPAIMAHAFRERRILVTLDKDFGDLAVRQRQPHAGLLRLVPPEVDRHASLILEALELHGDDLLAGAIVTVEEDRIRVRTPD